MPFGSASNAFPEFFVARLIWEIIYWIFQQFDQVSIYVFFA
jgi:hypothetical protein